ncbi:type I-E CRISPR-associated protein Cse2/CasB [Anaerococcus nagyae]|uniref:type I-E CRISPR-associated protein Cse2/CasB n=1 Tax=Anaerococcus nagyae TaxID=1755241 RepID=UPI00324AF2AE
MTDKVNTKKESVYGVTASILNKFTSNLDTPATKATLSNLRSSISKPYSQTIEIFSILYKYLPDSFISEYGDLSYQEKAIITSLQIFAVHQQGNSQSVLLEANDENKYKNIGYALKVLRTDENAKSTDRRFNAMISADTFEEFTFHLRQLISLLKSRSDQKVNYAKLAQDLYYFQIPSMRENIKLSWAKEYYKFTNKEKDNKGEENE